MAQADLLVKLLKNATKGDQTALRQIAENLIQEERSKGHRLLAERLTRALQRDFPTKPNGPSREQTVMNSQKELFFEITPERELSSLVLPAMIEKQIREVVEEQNRSELLHSYNLKARHRLMFTGPPGNGKTTLAEALAFELMYPLIIVRYESLIGSYLGETSGRLKSLLEYARTQRCVLFFDEFETLGKERGDARETGEIKRIVSSLLLQTDALPDYVVLVAASNHPELLDRAVWRRFQVRVELPPPTDEQLTKFVLTIAKRCKIDFGYVPAFLARKLSGLSFAEVEDFCLDVVRRAVLEHQTDNARETTKEKLAQLQRRLQTNKKTRLGE